MLEFPILGAISQANSGSSPSRGKAGLRSFGNDKAMVGQVQEVVGDRGVGFVFSDSRCQHFFSLGETEGSHGDEISPKPRIGVFVYFELCTDTVGLQSAKIVRRASKEEVEHYVFGPRGHDYGVIHAHISDCTRKRKRRLPISFRAALDLSLDV